MMTSFTSATFPLKQLLPISTYFCGNNNTLLKSIDTNPRRTSLGLPVSVGAPRPKLNRVFAVNSNRVSPQAFWEDPDDGSGSNYDEDDGEDAKVEENTSDFESNWEEEEDERVFLGTASYSADEFSTATTDEYEEDLRKEVEQLLGPEERDIFQQKVTPNLGKISTAKWKHLHSFALAGQRPHMDMLIQNGLHIDLADKQSLVKRRLSLVIFYERVQILMLEIGMVLPLCIMQFKLGPYKL